MNFMKIGNHLINLDCMTEIHFLPGRTAKEDRIDVHFGQSQDSLIIPGEEARETWNVLCRLAEKGENA